MLIPKFWKYSTTVSSNAFLVEAMPHCFLYPLLLGLWWKWNRPPISALLREGALLVMTSAHSLFFSLLCWDAFDLCLLKNLWFKYWTLDFIDPSCFTIPNMLHAKKMGTLSLLWGAYDPSMEPMSSWPVHRMVSLSLYLEMQKWKDCSMMNKLTARFSQEMFHYTMESITNSNDRLVYHSA